MFFLGTAETIIIKNCRGTLKFIKIVPNNFVLIKKERFLSVQSYRSYRVLSSVIDMLRCLSNQVINPWTVLVASATYFDNIVVI